MEKVFTEKDTFAAYNSACAWCKDNNFSYGSMCSPQPTAIVKGVDIFVAKWKNLTAKERRTVDGTITGEFREGPVTVKITSPFAEVRADSFFTDEMIADIVTTHRNDAFYFDK